MVKRPDPKQNKGDMHAKAEHGRDGTGVEVVATIWFYFQFFNAGYLKKQNNNPKPPLGCLLFPVECNDFCLQGAVRYVTLGSNLLYTQPSLRRHPLLVICLWCDLRNL